MSRLTQLQKHDDNESSGPRPPVLGEESCSKAMTEGTEINSKSSTPSCFNWAKSLQLLLDDDEGVDLLKKYVEKEEPCYEEHIKFYFAIDGVKRQTEEFPVKEFFKALYKYLRRAKSLKIPEAIRKEIREGLKNDKTEIGIDIFDPMHNEVGAIIRDEIYPAFLRSSTYISYINHIENIREKLACSGVGGGVGGGGGSGSGAPENSDLVEPFLNLPDDINVNASLVKYESYRGSTAGAFCASGGGAMYGASTSASSSGSLSATETLPRSSTLPTLHEDAELTLTNKFEKCNIAGRMNTGRPLRLTHELLMATEKRRLDIRPAGAPEYLPRPHIHVSYIPNSRVESDRGSVSSGHRTDSDVLSMSACSLDGRQYIQHRQYSQENKAIRQSPVFNKEVNHEIIIPRPERTPCSLNQEQLLAQLIPKLEKVKRERDKEEKLATEHDLLNDQDILDQHVSRVWKDQTPELTTGATSPLPAIATKAIGGPSMKHSKSLPEHSSCSGKVMSKWPSINTDSGISLFSYDSLRKYKGSSATPKHCEIKRRLEDEARLSQRNIQLKVNPTQAQIQAQALPSFSKSVSGGGISSLQKQVPPLPLPEKPQECTTVVFYFCDEEFPYRIKIPGLQPTLGQFRNYLPKKGSYRFFFKTTSEDSDCPVIQEELVNDSDILPFYDGKVAGLVKPFE